MCEKFNGAERSEKGQIHHNVHRIPRGYGNLANVHFVLNLQKRRVLIIINIRRWSEFILATMPRC